MPAGERWQYTSSTASSIFGYAGEQLDTTGLIYLRARYLNPRLGIFLARDPWSGDMMRPGSMNGFNYVSGNPINRVDPSGKVDQTNCAIEGAFETCTQCFLNELYKHADLTKWFVDEMNANRNSIVAEHIRLDFSMALNQLIMDQLQSQYGSFNPNDQGLVEGYFLDAGLKFKDVVQTHGLFDFKYAIRRIVGDDIRLGNAWYLWDTPGNIHFGYLGMVLGFPKFALHCGADWAQTGDLCGGTDLYSDYEGIEAGFDIARLSAGGDVTIGTLLTALYMHPGIDHGVPAIPNPESFRYPWPYPVGTFDDGSSSQYYKHR